MRPLRLRASILSFGRGARLDYHPDALLSVGADGRIEELRPLASRASRVPRGTLDRRGLLAIPGLIDAHCHASQYPAVASDGLELLPWLRKHIFPLENAFRGERARATAAFFFRELAAHGTTTACVYASVFKESAQACFEEARASGLRVILGKVMMDRGSYDAGFRAGRGGESRRELSLRESEELCRRWHGAAGGRLLYAFTPRFALSCSLELMRGAAALAERYGAYVQTHLSENAQELRAIPRLFPGWRSYTEVYAKCGLLGPRTLLAHAIWLRESEYRQIARSGAAVVHCPTSNAFLASGVMDCGRMRRQGIPLALGSDVAAGPSVCLFEVMRQAVYGQRLARAHGLFREAPRPTPAKAFYMATLGGARALGLDGKIGSLEPGKEADFVLIDPRAYDAGFSGPEDAEAVVARLVYRAGRRAVRAAFVAGRRVGGRL